MRSVTSCFNAALYKKDLARFWPLWALYAVIWLFALPVSLISQVINANQRYPFHPAQWAAEVPLSLATEGFGLFLALIFGAAAAMAVWSYLYHSRSANLMHALPVRREGHFLTHFLSGLTFFVGPHLLTFAVTLAAELAVGGADVGALAACFGIQTLLCLFFFSLATLCAMLTGHIVALPAFYAIFNALAMVMASLLEWVAGQFLYGYAGGLSNQPLVRWLTPVANLLQSTGTSYVIESSHTMSSMGTTATAGERVELYGMSVVWIYAAAGLVLAVLALLLYRRRHLETAGDVVAVSWLRPVFRYGVALCLAVSGGCMLYNILELGGTALFILCLLFWGLVGYFAAGMLLEKTFRVFRSGWKGCAGVACVLLALCAALQFDLLNIEGRVPALEDVESVYVSGLSTAPYDCGSYLSADLRDDPAAIAAVLSVHQTIADERGYREQGASELRAGQSTVQEFRVTYQLKNGATLKRSYSGLLLWESDLEDPASLAAVMTGLLNNQAVEYESYGLERLEKGTAVGAEVNDPEPSSCIVTAQGKDSSWIRDYYGGGSGTELTASQAALEALKEAVLADFAAGNLGTRYLFPDSGERENNTYYNDLTFYYEYKVQNGGERTYWSTEPFTITLTPRAEATLAALAELGVLDQVTLTLNGELSGENTMEIGPDEPAEAGAVWVS